MDWFQEITQNISDSFEEASKTLQDVVEDTGRGFQDAMDDTGKSLQEAAVNFGFMEEEELQKLREQESGYEIVDLQAVKKAKFEVQLLTANVADCEEDKGLSREFEIFIRFAGAGTQAKLEGMKATDTVIKLKKDIEYHLRVPPSQQNLYFCGKLLTEETKRLFDYDIHKEPYDWLSSRYVHREISLLKKAVNIPKEMGFAAQVEISTGPIKKGAVTAKPKPKQGAPAPKVAQKAPTTSGQPPLPIGLLFPGQGSQYVKMLSEVQDMPAVKDMLDKAKQILGYDILDLCLNGPESKLEETKFCQPAMFVAGLAAVEKLRQERPEAVERAQAMAGLSLGEYTALTAAGVFTFEDGLKLVKLRGEAMHEANMSGNQGMLSVAGLERNQLADLCLRAQNAVGGGEICCIANVLFPKGYSCAGNKKALSALKKLAEENGALQARLLKASGAFHTPLMEPAKQILEKALAGTNMEAPRCTVYFNVTGECLPAGSDPKSIRSLLADQLCNPVLWENVVKRMIDDKVDQFYEVGPMKQLKAMMKRIDQKMWNNMTNIHV